MSAEGSALAYHFLFIAYILDLIFLDHFTQDITLITYLTIVFRGQVPFSLSNKQHQSTEGKLKLLTVA